MGQKKIIIQNFKSIENIEIDVKSLNAFIGENSVGKSNILEAIRYFYENLCFERIDYSIFDYNNMLNNRTHIRIVYDFSDILKKINYNIKNNKVKNTNYYMKIWGITQGRSEISIEMYQIKGQKIIWNVDFATRKVISEMFPLYFVDTREIDLSHWNELWNAMGDLTKIDHNTQNNIQEQIKQEIENPEYGLEPKLKFITSIYESMTIKVKPFTSKEFAAAISQIYYTGKEFLTRERGLSFQSNGVNTYNYLSLFSYVLESIAEAKLKEPIVLMDEPEISLHNQLVDKLIRTIINCSKNLTYMISTHSTRLVKNILKDKYCNGVIYHVYKVNQYSCCKEFNLFEWKEKRERYFITDDHVNAYFAKALLLVEGETELELFNHIILKTLFPKLENIDVIKALSDEVIHKIVSPEKRNYNVPVVSLIDRDKIFSFIISTRKVSIQGNYMNRYHEREKYYYGKIRYNTTEKKKHIKAMADKCHFSISNRLLFTSNDTYYEEFNKYINDYFLNYNIIVQETSIEGMLITKENLEIFLEFFKNEFSTKYKHYETIKNGLGIPNKHECLNIMRLIFGGENDFLLTKKKLKKEVWEKSQRSVSSKLLINYDEWINAWNQCSVDKTDWVSRWLLYYFKKITGENSEQSVLKIILEERQQKETDGKLTITTLQFQNHFRELFKLINRVCKMQKNNII